MTKDRNLIFFQIQMETILILQIGLLISKSSTVKIYNMPSISNMSCIVLFKELLLWSHIAILRTFCI